MRDVGWMDDANCAEVSPEVFFPEPERGLDADAAKQICRRCPVRRQCLEYAIKNRFGDGIWGGLNGSERSKIWRKK